MGAFNHAVISGFVFVFLILPIDCRGQGSTSPAGQGKWNLVWSDEFSGPNGSGVDPAKWTFDVGGGKWGNQELEHYTNRREDSHVEDGSFVIQAQREKYKDQNGVTWDYTSARLKTQGKFSQTYGRFEALIKVPYGQGLWPAFWMLGDDIDRVGWPGCGEIDIMENIGKEPSIIHGSIHGPGHVGEEIEAHYTLPDRKKFADDFHVFAVEWEPDVIRFYVDNDLYATRTRAELRPGQRWVYDHPFFLLLNVAVGGDWPGNPDASTIFPQRMLVDYVRVYRRVKE